MTAEEGAALVRKILEDWIVSKVDLRTGDLLYASLPENADPGAAEEVMRTLRQICIGLRHRGRSVVLAALPHGVSLHTATDAQMYEAGWTKFSEAREIADALRAELQGDPDYANAREHLPACLAVLKRLKAENAELRKFAVFPPEKE